MKSSEYAKGGEIQKGDKVKIKHDGKIGQVKSYRKDAEHYIIDFGNGITEPYGKKDFVKMTKGGLTGNQHKLDLNKNGKIDAEDFRMLRNK